MARQNFSNLTYSASKSSPKSLSSSASPRSPLKALDDNIMDSDDNTDFESSPCNLAITKSARAKIKSVKKANNEQFRERRLELSSTPSYNINVPMNKLPGGLSKSKTPKTPHRKLNFTPGHSVISYSKTSSPSKVRGAALLQRNRQASPPSEPQSPDISQQFQEEGWEDDEENEDYYYAYSAGQSKNRSETNDLDSEEIGQEQEEYRPLQDRVRGVFWDPMTPFIVSGHIQNGFNLFVLSAILYFFWIFFQTVRHDVDMKVEEYSSEIMAEMAVCSKEYIQNNCMPGRRVPALEKMCSSWEKCMNRDPAVVGRAKVGAETFGEIFNGFLRPISWKAMSFMVIFVGGTIVLSNLTLFYTRKNLQPDFDIKGAAGSSTPYSSNISTPRPPKTPKTPGTRFYTPRRALPSIQKRRGFSPLLPGSPSYARIHKSPGT